MKLENGILRPATVVEVVDNKGTIKVEAPGLFSITDDPSLLPNVYPLFLFGTNSFSTPVKADEVWVLSFSDNDQQLYWFRKDSLDDNQSLLIDKEGKIDVLLNRNTFSGWGTLYFSDGSGWVISRDGSKINIDSSGNIHLINPNPHRTISITDSGISLGSDGSSEHTACFGDVTSEVLYGIYTSLKLLKTSLQSSPFTAPAAVSLESIEIWKELIDKIESNHVTLD